MGQVTLRPSTVPSYEASCPGSHIPPQMDSQWGLHSNLRPEQCSFTHPLSSQWGKHSSQWDPRIKAPRGPVKTLACIKSPAVRGFGTLAFPAGVSMPMPPLCAARPPAHPCCDAAPQKAAKCPAQGNGSHLGAQKEGGIGGVPIVQRSLYPRDGHHIALVGVAQAQCMAALTPQLRNQPLPPPPPFFYFFLLFSSFFFSFFLLFLFCSDESDDSSLEELPASGEGR